jgi:hypothetical protein
MALHNVQSVGREVFAGDKPRRVFATATRLAFGFQPANAKTLALPQCVKAQAHVLTNALAKFVFDGAGFVGYVAIQKLAKRALAYKTNTCRVLFLGVG